jgi:predicted 3-demethylubiquinone-9 3-methyltransferase (glyoxalase superfamily)
VAKKIVPCLWFTGRAQEAIDLYTSLFKNSKVLEVTRYGDVDAMPSGGDALVARIELEGQEVMILSAGPDFPQTEAFSFYVHCKDQAEVDYYWNALTADGGQESMCGWLKDKFGVSWQIVPEVLDKMLADPERKKAGRAMQAMLGMQKLDIAGLQKAYAGQ